MKQQTLSVEDVLFIPNEEYISLLKEFAYMCKSNVKNNSYRNIRQRLGIIEVSMSAGDIIRNTKTAFKN